MTLEEKIKAYPAICYTRVVGWLTPTKSFNPGKFQEHADRVNFVIKEER